MKRFAILAASIAALLVSVSAFAQTDDTPDASVTAASADRSVLADPAGADLLMSLPLDTSKKCGFDSDCPHGKCKSGKCGGCGFDSDCKGWGKCKSGWCGGCNFDSECKGFGKCKSGKCEKSPY